MCHIRLSEFPLMCAVLRYPAQLPPLGWSPSPMPGHMAPLGPIGAMEPDWRDIKANLRPRIVSMDGAEASPSRTPLPWVLKHCWTVEHVFFSPCVCTYSFQHLLRTNLQRFANLCLVSFQNIQTVPKQKTPSSRLPWPHDPPLARQRIGWSDAWKMPSLSSAPRWIDASVALSNPTSTSKLLESIEWKGAADVKWKYIQR